MKKKGSVQIEIESRIKSKFAPTLLHVVDDSHKHAGHAGARPEGETHFRVQVVSEAFAGKTKVERQRQVAGVLKDLFETHIHALQLHTFTPEEYAKRH